MQAVLEITGGPQTLEGGGGAPTNVGSVLDGKYLLRAEIGEGSAGTVYEAEHLIMGKRVAIKVLRPALAKIRTLRMGFVAEAQAAARIGHANVVDIYDLGVTSDGASYLVMELLRGESMEQLIETNGAFGVAPACELMLQVLAGLAAAHAVGIVHCDLKPGNVIVTRPRPDRPLVKVLDFGIARGVNGAMEAANGMVCGTPGYMSPEQALDGAVDARSDIYSAAAMLYEMLAGSPPFSGDDPEQVIVQLLQGEHRLLREANPSLPRDLCDLVERGLARDPEDRPQSVHELAAGLRPLVGPGRGASIVPFGGLTFRPAPPLRPQPVLVLAAPTPSLAIAACEIACAARLSIPGPPRLPDPEPAAPRRRSAPMAMLASGLGIAIGAALGCWSMFW